MTKRCTKCGVDKPLEEFNRERRGALGRRAECRDCRKRQAAATYWADPEVSRERKRESGRIHWGERGRESLRARHRRARAAVFGHYGWSCACCGSTRHLQIDHLNGGGTEHRIALFGSRTPGAYNMYRWLATNGFPGGFQTLCASCNKSKRDGDRCRLSHGTEVA